MFAANAFDHVFDSRTWHFFESKHIEWPLPWGLKKYHILMVLVAFLIILIYVPLAQRARSGKPLRGGFLNAFESMLTFIREQIAKPYLGHDADHYVHYLWTVFLFVLFCNVLGMIPFLGSPTADFTVTVVLASCTFVFINGSAIMKMGFKHYMESFYPHLDVPFPMNVVVGGLIAFLEFVGGFIKHFVLAVRLYANMLAGHVVLATILLFILDASKVNIFLQTGVTFASVIGVTLLSLLELFVAFLQAYVFTFLTALFLGSALHPQH